MTLFARFFRLVWGGDVDRALRPVLAVSLVGSIAGSSAYPFMGIWAIRELGAPQATLAFSYLVGAVLSGLTGYVGGHWSDRIGRRPLILFGWGFQALVPLTLIAVGHHVYFGLGLLALMPVFGSLGGAADTAMVADLVAPERHEAAYASVRVAANLGVTIGPPIGGLLLVGGHWTHLWLGTLLLSAVGFAIAFRYIPRGGAYAPAGPPQRGSFAVIIRDSPVPALHARVRVRDDDLRRDRDAAPDLGDHDAPPVTGAVGAPDGPEPTLRDGVSAAADAPRSAHTGLAEARSRDADDGVRSSC